MGRKPLSDQLKRKQLTVRMDPPDVARLERLADENGLSVPAQIEQLALDRLNYLEAYDSETRDLLDRIGDGIAQVHRLNPGKRWHKSRHVWASLAEMLHRGPIHDVEPDRPTDDDVVNEAWDVVYDTREEKAALSKRLAVLGVSVSPVHPVQAMRKPGGLFGQQNALLATFQRETEAAAIESIPDEEQKKEARSLFAKMKQLDDIEEAARRAWLDRRRPYLEAVEDGRRQYQAYLQRVAERKRDEGEDYNFNHLTGYFS